MARRHKKQVPVLYADVQIKNDDERIPPELKGPPVVEITFGVRVEDLEPFLRSVAPDPDKDPALVVDWFSYVLHRLRLSPPQDGRPRQGLRRGSTAGLRSVAGH